MTLPLSHQKIADALSVPIENVSAYWPAIETCLDSLNCGSLNSKIGALATIAVETANTFKPIHEYGTIEYLNDKYDTRIDLGNTPDKDGDGAKFAGRGFIQITGKYNYLEYGKQLGINMIANPDLACDANVAASIFAAFWHFHLCYQYAEAGNWKEVRRKVNGGTHNLVEFLHYVSNLSQAALR